jgi:L-threonylcarbamoyladenylate synthase
MLWQSTLLFIFKENLMFTEIIECSKEINLQGINRAAQLLRAGQLVGIPTETVYGLAANALNEKAVAAIFEAKGRPQDNPLIVHLASPDWLPTYALQIPDTAKRLMEAFWPGPLTIILKKSPLIPSIVSAGLDTAAFRCPSHPVAHSVIEAAGLPIAAPSANLSGSPSPTKASHVMHDLSGKIAAVVDGGDCGVGLESTVITLCTARPRILRPGGVTPEQLRAVLGEVDIDRAVLEKIDSGVAVASPGMKYKHYAPKAHVIIVKGDLKQVAAYVNARVEDGVVSLCFDGEESTFNVPCVSYGLEENNDTQARGLFDSLRELDRIGAKTVYARCPNVSGVGLAVYNRLLRAAAFEVIEP